MSELRLKWDYGELLDDFQNRMVKICERRKERQPYEIKRFDDGWMYIEWSSYKLYDKQNVKLKSNLADTIYNALETEGEFIFDDNSGLWAIGELVPSIKELVERMNPRMAAFLDSYNGEKLLLNNKREGWLGEDDWVDKRGYITWFLKKP